MQCPLLTSTGTWHAQGNAYMQAKHTHKIDVKVSSSLCVRKTSSFPAGSSPATACRTKATFRGRGRFPKLAYGRQQASLPTISVHVSFLMWDCQEMWNSTHRHGRVRSHWSGASPSLLIFVCMFTALDPSPRGVGKTIVLHLLILKSPVQWLPL